MYCQECGNKLPVTAKFCNNCGTKVPVEETVEEVKEAKTSQAESEVAVPKNNKKKTGKSKKKLLGIIAGVFVMLAVVIGGFFVYLENRTLFTLVNPEFFFGKCTEYVSKEDLWGNEYCIFYFETEEDIRAKAVEYCDLVNRVDSDLLINGFMRDTAEEEEISESWRYRGNAIWTEYSIPSMQKSHVVSLDCYRENGYYVVKIRIDCYKYCEFLDVNPNNH